MAISFAKDHFCLKKEKEAIVKILVKNYQEALIEGISGNHIRKSNIDTQNISFSNFDGSVEWDKDSDGDTTLYFEGFGYIHTKPRRNEI